MNRFRAALLALVVLTLVVVVVAVFRPAMPPSLSNGASAALLPAEERSLAPGFSGINGWINSTPLSIEKLRGRVVLVDFWTFSCVNCVRTLPHLQHLHSTYQRNGFVIVGVHSPEFDFEKVRANVVAAVERLRVTWPVALDTQMATWNAYGNQYWPAEYLIDKQGRIAYVHFGEGDYDTTERAVAALLGVSMASGTGATPVPNDISPELYAGSERGQLVDGETYGSAGQPVTYADTGPPAQRDAIQVTGTWTDEVQYLQADSAGHVRVRFHADSVYVVAGTTNPAAHVSVTLDNNSVPPRNSAASLTASAFTVTRQDLYSLLVNVTAGYHVLDLVVPAGFQLYTFTFG
jgi:thiol-disulfide isomerase/thioredoxin